MVAQAAAEEEEPGMMAAAAAAEQEVGMGLVAVAGTIVEAAEADSDSGEDSRCIGVAAEALGSFAAVQSQGSPSAGLGEKDRHTQ